MCFPVWNSVTHHLPLLLIIIPSHRHYPWPRRSKWLYPNFSVSLISSSLPGQLCQHPQASSLKQTIHTAIVHHATPLQEGSGDNSMNAGSQSPNNIDFVPINPERLQRMVNDSLCAIAYISALIVAGQTWTAKWWVGPMSVTTVGNISVLSVHWSTVGGPAVAHISTMSWQTWSPSNKNDLHFRNYSAVIQHEASEIIYVYLADLSDDDQQQGEQAFSVSLLRSNLTFSNRLHWAKRLKANCLMCPCLQNHKRRRHQLAS